MEPVDEVLDKNDPNHDPDVRGRLLSLFERCLGVLQACMLAFLVKV
jgi:hypothetical protein